MSDFRGLVLSNTTLNDSDIIMNVLSDEGIISIKAKGVLKSNSKNRNVTEVGCFSIFHTIDRLNQKVHLLKNAESIKRFNSINTDLYKQAIYQCLLEGFLKSEINLESAIKFVNLLEKSINPYCLYSLYLCYILKQSGCSIIVDECCICNSTSKLFGVSISDGGFICKDCFDMNKHLHINVSELKNIRYCMHAKISDYDILEKTTTISFETIQYLYSYIIQYGEFILKSHSFVEILQNT